MSACSKLKFRKGFSFLIKLIQFTFLTPEAKIILCCAAGYCQQNSGQKYHSNGFATAITVSCNFILQDAQVKWSYASYGSRLPAYIGMLSILLLWFGNLLGKKRLFYAWQTIIKTYNKTKMGGERANFASPYDTIQCSLCGHLCFQSVHITLVENRTNTLNSYFNFRWALHNSTT